MKILIVDRASAFSIWTLMNAVTAEAMARGHEVVHCVLDDGTPGAPPTLEGVRVHRIAVRPRRSLTDRIGQWTRFSRGFVRILRAERPDVVHTNFCVPGIAARFIARALGTRVVISTYHERRDSLNRLYRLGLAATDWTATRRVYVSASCAAAFGVAAPQVLTDAGDIPAGKDVVVRNGVAIRRPAPPESGRAGLRLVFAGRLTRRKSPHTLIEAAADLVRRGVPAELDIFGDGSERRGLEALAAGLDAPVRFHGWADHDTTLAAFAAADCVVIPSDGKQEGFGLVLAEALAVARCVVVSDIGVFREVADALTEGVEFFAPGDAGGLADAVMRALENRPSADAVAARQERARAKFDIARMAKIYLALYEGAG